MNRTVTKAMAGGLAVLGALSMAVQAAQPAPEERAFRGKPEISDAAMGNMRGRFISANQILYFGVEMYTEWSTLSGQLVASSALNIVVDHRNGDGTPTIRVTNDVKAPDPANGNGSGAAPSGHIISGNPGQAQGVSQLVQVTGNGNRITNGADVCAGAQCPTNVTGLPYSGGNNQRSNALTGATARVASTTAGVTVSVSTPQGMARQSITNMSGVQQHAQVTGDALSINNQLNMVIQVQPNGAVSAARMNNVLQSVRGL